MYFWKWNDAPYFNGCCLCFSFSSVNYLPNVFFMEFDRAQRNWSDLEVLLCSCLKEKAALGESLHTTNTAASSMAVAAALPNLNIWWATEHPSGACAWHFSLFNSFFGSRKLSAHLNLPVNTAVPATPTSQEGRRRRQERRSACRGGCSSHLPSANGRSSTELHVFRWSISLLELDSDMTGICDLSTDLPFFGC